MTISISEANGTKHAHCEESTSFQDLPEEVVTHILHYFDQEPPSISKSNQVPNIDLLHVQNAPMKACASVCRAWRRILFTRLFRCLRVPLEDVLPRWIYAEDGNEAEREHRELRLCARGLDWSCAFVPIPDGELWLPHRALDFFDFAMREGLGVAPFLDSLTIYTGDEVVVGVDTYPEEGSTRAGHLTRKGNFMKAHRTLAATSLWRHLFAYLDPSRLIVLAPPSTLGALMKNCVVDKSDAWAFDIKLQRLELLQPPRSRSSRYHHNNFPATNPAPLAPLQPNKTTARDLLEQRPWTSFSYHGGSCMNAYGTYHYFEKMPPCVLSYNPSFTATLGPNLTHFTYTSVFAHYVHFRGITTLISRLDALQELTLQLAPAADSETLDDLDLISKGHMSLRDCWMEVERSYAELIRTLLCREPEPVMPELVRFTSWDCTKGALKEELETLFAQDAPGWKRVSEFAWECK